MSELTTITIEATGAADAPVSPATGHARPKQRNEHLAALKPLAIDVALPLGSYYLLHDGFGLGLVSSLALSSVGPAIRTVLSALRDRSVNGLAGLILMVNLAGIAVTFITGSPRLMMAKDSVVSSVVALGILLSVVRGKPLMTTALQPMLVKGDAAKAAAWERLVQGSAAFRRVERRFSVVWGLALLAECVARVIGAITLPVPTMVWLSNVILLSGIALAIVVSGPLAVGPMEKMIGAEAAK
jgi:hypothetical protein